MNRAGSLPVHSYAPTATLFTAGQFLVAVHGDKPIHARTLSGFWLAIFSHFRNRTRSTLWPLLALSPNKRTETPKVSLKNAIRTLTDATFVHAHLGEETFHVAIAHAGPAALRQPVLGCMILAKNHETLPPRIGVRAGQIPVLASAIQHVLISPDRE